MYRESLDKYFGLGARLVYMRQAQEGTLVHGEGFIKVVIEKFLQDIERFPMQVSRIAAEPLREFLKKFQVIPLELGLLRQKQKNYRKLHKS